MTGRHALSSSGFPGAENPKGPESRLPGALSGGGAAGLRSAGATVGEGRACG